MLSLWHLLHFIKIIVFLHFVSCVATCTICTRTMNTQCEELRANTLPAAQLPPASISWCTLPRLVDRGSKQSSVQGFPGVTFHGASIIRFQDSDWSILAQKTLIRDGNSAHNGKKSQDPTQWSADFGAMHTNLVSFTMTRQTRGRDSTPPNAHWGESKQK